MNTENSKTSEPHRSKLDLTDKLNLKNPKQKFKHFKQLISAFITLGKTSSQNTTTINLKFQHRLGMILLIYQMVLTQFLIFKIILNSSLKNLRL